MVVGRRRTVHGLASAEEWAHICPYLLDESRTWRAIRPSAEHRCTAVSPPVPLTSGKQRSLCLAATHLDCPTYVAARELRGRTLGPAVSPARSVFGRTAPIVLERPGPLSDVLGIVRTSLPQIGLVVLMVLAAVALVLARLAGP